MLDKKVIVKNFLQLSVSVRADFYPPSIRHQQKIKETKLTK